MKHIFIFDGNKMEEELKDILLKPGCLGWVRADYRISEEMIEDIKNILGEKGKQT